MKFSPSFRCRVLLRGLPQRLQDALTLDAEIYDLADLGHGTASTGLPLDLRQIRELLQTIPMGETVQVPVDDETFPLRRSHDGIFVGNKSETEAMQMVSELGLMDASASVRVTCLEAIISRCWPTLPQADRWRRLTAHRSLTTSELSEILDARRSAPRSFFEQFEAKTEFSIDELVPASALYYEALLGAACTGEPYSVQQLETHLRRALAAHATWGWRLVRAAYVGDFFSPTEICSLLAEDALAGLIAQDSRRSPASILAVLEVALARHSDPRFLSIGLASLRELGMRVQSRHTDQTSTLVSALTRLTFTRLVYLLPEADATWRRMAALIHANLLAESLGDEPGLASVVQDYCNSRVLSNITAEIWDMREGANWQLGFELSMDLWFKALARAGQLVERARAAGALLDTGNIQTDFADFDVVSVGAILGMFASPMDTGTVVRDRAGASIIALSDTGLEQFDTPWSSSNWSLLVAYSMMGVLENAVFERMIAELGRAQHDPDEARNWSLIFAARIAAAQGNAALAEVVATHCINTVERAQSSDDLGSAFQAVGFAAGAMGSEWLPWLGSALRGMADKVPRGPYAEALARAISSLQQLVPFERRQWAQALAAARCAA